MVTSATMVVYCKKRDGQVMAQEGGHYKGGADFHNGLKFPNKIRSRVKLGFRVRFTGMERLLHKAQRPPRPVERATSEIEPLLCPIRGPVPLSFRSCFNLSPLSVFILEKEPRTAEQHGNN
jgi:hypothetical protein